MATLELSKEALVWLKDVLEEKREYYIALNILNVIDKALESNG